MLLTAIIEEETVLVKAMNKRKKNAMIPLSPMSALMVYGITMPELTSVAVRMPGYVGKIGVLWIALVAKPTTVPRPQGIPKTANAAILYPGTVALTSVAKDFCQNAVSYR